MKKLILFQDTEIELDTELIQKYMEITGVVDGIDLAHDLEIMANRIFSGCAKNMPMGTLKAALEVEMAHAIENVSSITDKQYYELMLEKKKLNLL